LTLTGEVLPGADRFRHLRRVAEEKMTNTSNKNERFDMKNSVLAWVLATRFVFYLVLTLWAALGVPSVALGQNSRIEQGQIFSSALTNNLLGDSGTRPFSVYLPPSYDSSQKRYPVVYALHEYGGSHHDMEALQPSLDAMTATGTIGEMIVVFVNGTNRLWGSQYLSSPVIGDYETYITKDLVTYIDAHYRTLATWKSRGITGVSMGGFGSMRLALKFPEIFSVAVPNAGYYNALGDDAQFAFQLLAQEHPTNLTQFDQLTFPLNWAQSLLAGLLPDLQRPELYTDSPYELINGQLVPVDAAQQRLQDGDVLHGELGRYLNQPVRLNAIKIVCGTNDSLIAQARDFTNALTVAGLNFTYEEHSGGHLYVPELSLPFLSTNLQGAEPYVPPPPPRIIPTASLQHQAADLGGRASFAVTASGAAPLAYQWMLDGHELAGQTNRTLTFSAVQAADEGDYTVVATNLAGTVTSDPVRLWVVPPASKFIKANFTNSLGRLPYFYLLPTNYNATGSYALELIFPGGYDENMVANESLNLAATKTVVSYRQQERDPLIQVWLAKRAGDASSPWTDAYLRQASALLDQFIPQFHVNTNRVHVATISEGFHAAWDLIAMKPAFFAGALLVAGYQGASPAASLTDVPVWACCARDDAAGQLSNTQAAVRALRLAGGNVRYTEYATGTYYGYDTHTGSLLMAAATPAIIDWQLAQRRGAPSTAQPLLTITNPTAQTVWLTGATNLSLAGSALALDQNVTRVAWENTANHQTGVATGSNAWNVTNLPLTANRTNVMIVTGTSTSWAPACGGNTTFNDTLTVVCSPVQATLALQGTSALLNWTGGGPPFRIQRATDLIAADWMDVLSDATPPVILPVTGPCGFYRIVGR
jgi:S-formylglutathione hydrolase